MKVKVSSNTLVYLTLTISSLLYMTQTVTIKENTTPLGKFCIVIFVMLSFFSFFISLIFDLEVNIC